MNEIQIKHMHCRESIRYYKRIQVKVILAVVKQLKQLQRKPRKNYVASTGFAGTHDLHDTSAMLYQLIYEASWKQARLRVQFITVI